MDDQDQPDENRETDRHKDVRRHQKQEQRLDYHEANGQDGEGSRAELAMPDDPEAIERLQPSHEPRAPAMAKLARVTAARTLSGTGAGPPALEARIVASISSPGPFPGEPTRATFPPQETHKRR